MSRYDKTLAELTPKDILIIATTVGAVQFCGRVASSVIALRITRKVNAHMAKETK